jgi:ABC-2 type transport system permease protein
MVALMTVFRKELEDHFNNWRFISVFMIVFIPSIYFIWKSATSIGSVLSPVSHFFFLPVFVAPIMDNPITLLPNSFLELIGVLLPLVGIALGLDAINSEKNNGTLSRLISQPIFRDSVINAKFLAGVVAITILMTSVILIATGISIWIIGVFPTVEEIWRLFFFLVISIIYGSFWLGLAILFSTLFKRVVTSAVLSLAVWLLFAIFFPLIIQLLGNSLVNSATSNAELYSHAQLVINISRISPIQLFNESMAIVLLPQARTLSQMLILSQGDAGSYLLSNPLSIGQSLLVVWPQIMITVLLTLICFAISYVKFMREEIRST